MRCWRPVLKESSPVVMCCMFMIWWIMCQRKQLLQESMRRNMCGQGRHFGKVTVTKVEGNHCKKGAVYGEKEVTAPTRIVTSTVTVLEGEIPVVPVKTASDIPKDKILACVQALKNVKVTAPVEIGDVIVHDIVHTGVAVVATKKIRVNATKKYLYKEL